MDFPFGEELHKPNTYVYYKGKYSKITKVNSNKNKNKDVNIWDYKIDINDTDGIEITKNQLYAYNPFIRMYKISKNTEYECTQNNYYWDNDTNLCYEAAQKLIIGSDENGYCWNENGTPNKDCNDAGDQPCTESICKPAESTNKFTNYKLSHNNNDYYNIDGFLYRN